jgi:hypothetical protein
LTELGLESVGAGATDPALAVSRDVVIDGERRFDLRVTVAWVAGAGLSLWAYYGLEAMELPRRTLLRLLRANFDLPMVKFAITEDDRPMLMSELPPGSESRDELGRGLTRLALVADRLLEETAAAVADRAQLPDWTTRTGRNPGLLAAYRGEVEASLPAMELTAPPRKRRGPLARLLHGAR